MMKASMILPRHAALLMGVSLSALATNGLAQNIGTAGAVNPLTQGTPPGGGTRQVTLGSQVIFKERFVTSAVGSLQLVFLDKSTLNIGPNSDVVINEYVYDPARRDGKMSIGLAKGALRFVGGQISHNGNAEIKTPVATIGLRGAVATTSFNPQSQMQTTSSIVGSATVTGLAGGTVTMVQGYTTTVGQGQQPAPPTRTPPQILASATGQTTSQPGQTGGAAQPPSNQSANTQLAGPNAPSQIVLAQTQSTNQVAQQTSNTSQSVTDTRQSTQVTSTTTAAAPLVQNIQASLDIQASLAPRALAYVVSGPGAGGSIPYLTAAFIGTASASTTPLLGYRVGGADNVASSETIRTLQIGFGINGRGAAQTSVFSLATETFFQGGQETLFNGGLTATSRQSATQRVAFALSAVSSVPGSVQLASDGSRIPVSLAIDQNDYNRANQPVADVAVQFGGTIPGNGQNYTFTQSAVATAVPAGLGANRPNLSLAGYAGGILETGTFDASGNRIATQFANVTGRNGDGSDVAFVFDGGTSRASADIQLASRSAGSRLVNGAYQFGSVDTTQQGRSTYIDTNTFALRDRTVRDPNTTAPATDSPAPYISSTGSGTYRNIQSGLTSWDTIIGTNLAAAQAVIAATDITPCQCEFTKWGFWSTRAIRDNPGGGNDQERGHLLTWVAGQLADRSLIPTTGSATYSGHIIGNVQFGPGSTSAPVTNTGTNYVAGGTFNHTVNFGQGTGSLAFTFDQRNYAGTSTLNAANRANFSGSFAATGSPVPASGSLQGSFFGPNSGAGTAPLEQGGQFTITGAPPSGPGVYNAAGIFAARR